jgi:hypothetical protein
MIVKKTCIFLGILILPDVLEAVAMATKFTKDIYCRKQNAKWLNL